MKVLIVDDIESNRKLLRVNLEAEGLETCEAMDGIKALTVLQDEKVDAIISDILMPHMDGYQFCQKVRKDQRFGDLPFIFYTSTYTSPSDEKLAMNCGADRYIKKPAPVGVIMSTIRELSDPGWQRTKSVTLMEESLVMRQYNQTLVRKLEERNEKLEQAHVAIALANRELERRVDERTAELLILNKELEAFSHSIAHDLRSPLTAINGYSSFLVEECRGKVSPQAMDDLQFIIEAVGRMNDLTSDLLRLALANRAEMSEQTVCLSELAAGIFDELQTTAQERSVEFRCLPGITGKGDMGLLRIALENLLNNAWKYTSKTKLALIEFGFSQQAGTSVFFVRDNGAGFAMASANKLFSPFCRLHSGLDFAGTGIGLSTVQRIIVRHGGRIWAEAAVGKGATFFFTLGVAAQKNVLSQADDGGKAGTPSETKPEASASIRKS